MLVKVLPPLSCGLGTSPLLHPLRPLHFPLMCIGQIWAWGGGEQVEGASEGRQSQSKSRQGEGLEGEGQILC